MEKPIAKIVCAPPAVEVCEPAPSTVCFCATPVPKPPLCTVSFVYSKSDPGSVYLAASEPHCDQAGMELAIAILLARLLGAPH